MSFLDLNNSVSSGKPIEFYDFVLGSETFRLNSSRGELTLLGNTYMPAIIDRDKIDLTCESKGTRLEIRLSGNSNVSQLYKVFVPFHPMYVVIRQQHLDDNDPIVVWSGMVRSVAWDKTLSKLLCESVAKAAGRTGLFKYYETLCDHIWGSWQCGVNVSDYTFITTVTAISDNSLLCSHGQVADYFVAGFVEHGDGDFRMITASDTTSITLPFQFENVFIGDKLTLYAGCDRTHGMCKDKFDNSINHGGCLFVPSTNPFVEGIV